MQDGDKINGDEAGDWLRAAGEPEISITWEVKEKPNPTALAWMLDVLFAPRPEDEAA